MKKIVRLFFLVSILLSNTALFAQYTVRTVASPSSGGVVNGNNGTYADGENAVLTAVPNAGYIFQEWRDNFGNTYTDNPHTFTITQNVRITARFIPGYPGAA